MFRNYYVRSAKEGEFDALDDGGNSCAFYVSALLLLFKKISGTHGTVVNTVKDLEKSGWETVKKAQPGDVIVWEAMDFPDGRYEHIGFCVAPNKAVSTSWEKKVVVGHDLKFGDTNRPIKRIYRISWAD